MDLIGISIKNDPQSQSSEVSRKFIVPLSEYRKNILSRIRNIKPDNQITVNERKSSCFGQALNISISLAEVSTVSTRIINLVGNPCTIGPGTTISTNFK